MLKPVMEKLLITISIVLLCMSVTPSIGAVEADNPAPIEPVEPLSFDVSEKPVLPSVPEVVVVPPPPPEIPAVPEILAAPSSVTPPDTQTSPDQPVLPAAPVRVSEPAVVSPPEPVDVTGEPATVSATPPAVTLPEVPVAAEVAEEPDTVIAPESAVPLQAVSVEEALELAIAPTVEVLPDMEQPVQVVVLPPVGDVSAVADQEIIEEIVMSPAEPVTPDTTPGTAPVNAGQPETVVEVESMAESEIVSMLGEDTVAAMVAQPDIPQELRPDGIPQVLPGRVTNMTKAVDEGLLLTDVPKAIQQKEPFRPPQLLPVPGPEPGVVYIAPFVSVMVPKEVSSRIFDQFVDELIREGEGLDLEFVIIKQGLKDTEPKWLASRKYVTGEIYAYVEDSGCCSTDMRAKARITYRRPQQETPAFGFEYPVTNFFDHDQSTVDIERIRLADDIATTLAGELVRALQN